MCGNKYSREKGVKSSAGKERCPIGALWTPIPWSVFVTWFLRQSFTLLKCNVSTDKWDVCTCPKPFDPGPRVLMAQGTTLGKCSWVLRGQAQVPLHQEHPFVSGDRPNSATFLALMIAKLCPSVCRTVEFIELAGTLEISSPNPAREPERRYH